MKCKQCNLEKTEDSFYFRKNRNKYSTICKDCAKTNSKDKYIKNRYNILEQKKEYRKNNSAKISKYGKKWREDNKQKILENNRFYKKKKRETDIIFRLHCNISSSISRCVKRKTTTQYLKTFGYTIDNLVEHLESLFEKGMNWENYGKWHIDHIYPVSKFNLEDEEQLKRCWALDNLQPLWDLDNIKKGNKV